MPTINELRVLQALDINTKIRKTQNRIREWYEFHGADVYVSFSGGKDSTVLLHLVRELYPEVPAVFCDTGLEYPEIRNFVKTFDNVVWVRPNMPFTKVIEEYGYPVISKEQSQYITEFRNTKSEKLKLTRLNGNNKGIGKISNKWKFLIDAPFKISHKCCDVMKKRPVKKYEHETGRKPFIGTMAHESSMRERKYLTHGCNSFEGGKPMSSPLGFWVEQDIYEYLITNNLGIAEVYGDIIKTENGYKTTGVNRTGCMFCMYGVHLESFPNRFQRMQKTHPKQYDYCMNKLGIKAVMEYINIPYADNQMTIDDFL